MICLLYRKYFLLLGFLFISVGFKCIPHLPDFSPQIVLFIYLGACFSRVSGFLNILLISVITDWIYSAVTGFPALGSWVFFTYSAYFMIGFIAHWLKIRPASKLFILQSVFASFGFWLWSNLEPWWFTNMYAHTLQGFIHCYFLALPFLGFTVAGALMWSVVILLLSKYQINILQCAKPLYSRDSGIVE